VALSAACRSATNEAPIGATHENGQFDGSAMADAAPVGGLIISSPLTLLGASYALGSTVSASVTYRNDGASPLALERVVLTTRPPGGTNAGGPFDDLAPSAGAATLAPGQTLTLQASRTLSAGDPTGSWTAFSTWQDAAGTYHDGPSVSFTVAGGPPTTTGNPFAGVAFYLDPSSPARAQADAWRSTRPADAAQMDKIANTAKARWFGDWNANIQGDVDSYVSAAATAGQLPLLVAYNIVRRDCGSFSLGGASSPDAYKAWVRSFAAGVHGRRAAVILEPDALAQTNCLSADEVNTRYALISDAVSVLSAGSTAVYIDAGNSGWLAAADAANRLQQAGVANARGFSTNVSNFNGTSNELAYDRDIASRIGSKHFVIDTSRNGLGPGDTWCNPAGRALGVRSTATTGDTLADAFFWVKGPGESDGSCNGGPTAGQWWADYALGLAQRAAF
jgi:endoglucanase